MIKIKKSRKLNTPDDHNRSQLVYSRIYRLRNPLIHNEFHYFHGVSLICISIGVFLLVYPCSWIFVVSGNCLWNSVAFPNFSKCFIYFSQTYHFSRYLGDGRGNVFSTSPPNGNQVDGLPPVPSISERKLCLLLQLERNIS